MAIVSDTNAFAFVCQSLTTWKLWESWLVKYIDAHFSQLVRHHITSVSRLIKAFLFKNSLTKIEFSRNKFCGEKVVRIFLL